MARQPALRTPMTEGGERLCHRPVDSRPPTQINISVRYATGVIALKGQNCPEVLIGLFGGYVGLDFARIPGNEAHRRSVRAGDGQRETGYAVGSPQFEFIETSEVLGDEHVIPEQDDMGCIPTVCGGIDAQGIDGGKTATRVHQPVRQ